MRPTALAALLLVTAPATLPAQSRGISASDKATGAQAHPQLLAQYGGAYRGPQSALVARVDQRVAVQSGLSNAGGDFIVTLLDSPVENAFAIPGGYVYVTRQLLALVNSEAELASVLGHEVGHVAARHAAKRNTRAQLGGLAAAVVGAVTGSDLAGRAAGYGSQLYTLGFSRKQEYEADGLGVRYIAAAGYTPHAAADMLAELNESSQLQAAVTGRGIGGLTWMSTHPNGADRIARAARLADATRRPDTTGVQDTGFLRALDGLPYDDGSKVVRIHTVRVDETARGLAARMTYPSHQLDRFSVLNAIDPDAPLRPGTLVKLIVAR
ncbi:M48 family metalloprotease [Sphingomonas sp.]|jgi:predicted Zn-dependent protease|uniref:M48 family metalloprotease n=1 Tax=Sphingomonas sp. TaxID=28214 RepID=UPI002D802E6E|nr:M48 family metalloprotease [Sphingomonas sp.]HEU0045602.1 M48 family metalloprotease [Sphingomonas sp.]